MVPKPKSGLSYRIVKLATDMFARDTGFSGPEIHRMFADYTDVLGPYTMGGGGPSRWELFETGLGSMSVDDQRRLLLDLCTYDGPSKYPMPSDEDIATSGVRFLARIASGYLAVEQNQAANIVIVADVMATRHRLCQGRPRQHDLLPHHRCG